MDRNTSAGAINATDGVSQPDRAASSHAHGKAGTVTVGSVSDNHFWSVKGSLAHERRMTDQLDRQVGRFDHFVFNGDLADYEASRYSVPDTTRRAVAYVARFAKKFPNTEIHYVLGNHDGTQGLYAALRKAAKKLPNLHVHPVGVRIGEALFMHGDRAHVGGDFFRSDGAIGNDSFRVAMPEEIPRFSKSQARIERLAVKTNLQHVADLYNRPSRIIAELQASLTRYPNPVMDGVKHVVTGHTHLAYEKKKDGITWHNSGAMVPGTEAKLVSISVKRGPWTSREKMAAWEKAQEALVRPLVKEVPLSKIVRKRFDRVLGNVGRRLGLTRRYPSGVTAKTANMQDGKAADGLPLNAPKKTKGLNPAVMRNLSARQAG